VVRARLVEAAPDMPLIRQAKGLVDLTQAEADGFWAWAVIETLRHTGIRVEELLELTQLSLRHYTSSTTRTLVPLLHIVPSKTDAERLIPMTPELVTVLVAVQRRARAGGERSRYRCGTTRTKRCTVSRSRTCSRAGSAPGAK
jgi:site-specific recombinase XerD